MIEVQAVIGRIQLRRMSDWHAARFCNARMIWHVAERLVGLRVPQPGEDVAHAAYKCYLFVEPQRLSTNWSRDRIIQEIVAAGVPCYAGSCSEIYLEKAFEGTGWQPHERLAVARELGETSLMFLVHPTLLAKEIEQTCSVLQAVMARAVH